MCTPGAYRIVTEFRTVLDFEPRRGKAGARRSVPSKALSRIAVNERGLRIGESHPGAVLTDHEVELLLELRDEGYSYSWLADKFEISKGAVAKICSGQRRCQRAVAWRAVS